MPHGVSWGWLAGAAIAFGCNLLLHLPVTNLSDSLVRRFGFQPYNEFLAAGCALLATGIWIALGLRRHKRAHLLWVAATLLIAFAMLAQRVLLVASIENIHYPQYALVAFLLGRGGVPLEATWLGATALGAVDEGYQYVFLRSGRPEYLDWNDILLNAVGAAFGLVALLAANGQSATGVHFSTRVAGGIIVATVGLALALAPPSLSPFFTVTAVARYHIVSASEAVALLGALWLGVRYVMRRYALDAAARPG